MCSAASLQREAWSGHARLPSYRTMVAPRRSPETWTFHIIQLVVENQKNRDRGCTSKWMPRNFKCSRVMPPCPCTMPLGRPVVPDEYSTQSGWSKGTARYLGIEGLLAT